MSTSAWPSGAASYGAGDRYRPGMTHSAIRVAELAEDANSPIGYSPTGNYLVVSGTIDKPLGGHVLTVPIVRGYGLDLPRRNDPNSGVPASPEQVEALHREENGGPPSGLGVVRVHGEVQLRANLTLLGWLMSVAEHSGVVSVDVWLGTGDEVPAWDHTSVRLLRTRDLFVTVTGDVLKHPVPAEDVSAEGQDVEASTWYQNRSRTTTPPPMVPDGRTMQFVSAEGQTLV